MGKRKTNAKRYKSGKCKGRLKPTPKIDKGNPKAKAKLDYWNAMCWQGGGHGRHASCPVGLLWLAGCLDGHDVPGEEMVSAFQNFDGLRRAKFGPRTPQAIDYTPRIRSSADDDGPVQAVRIFNEVDAVLREDMKAWQAVKSLMEDGLLHNTELDCPYWVQRFVDEARLVKGLVEQLPPHSTPGRFDRESLESAVRGLSILAQAMGGKKRKAA